MASTYTANNGIEKPDAGDQEGAWGGTLNTNFDIIDRVLSGVGSISLSGTTHTLTTTDGTLTDGMYRVLLFTGALGANNTVTISPNDQDKLYFVVNSTTDSGSSGPYSVIVKQGTGATVTVANGAFDIVYADGAGAGAAVTSLLSKKLSTGAITTSGNIVIPDSGNIGSASDTDAMAISSGGVVAFSAVPTFPNDTIETADIQDNAVTLAKMAGLARGKIIYGDASGDPAALAVGSTNTYLKSDGTDISWASVSASVALDDITTGDAASTLATTTGNITIDAQATDADVLIKVDDGGSSVTAVTFDGSDEGNAIFVNDIQLKSDGALLEFGADNDVVLTHVADTGLTLSSTGNNDTALRITSTATDAGVAPNLYLTRDSASPADNDLIGDIIYEADNDAGEKMTFVQFYGTALDVSDGTEDGDLKFQVVTNGAYTTPLTIRGSGVIVPDAGTIGSASDTDAISIASTGIVTFAEQPSLPYAVKNYIYNGDTSLCQRATEVTGIGNGDTGYHVQDRWAVQEGGSVQSEFTMSRATEVPNGFQYSLKLACTIAESAVAADEFWWLEQRLEGQDLFAWKKGTADALPVTLSFWVNATKTGTNIVSLYDIDNTRHISKSYTVNSSNTWEYKTITFAGDTTGAFGRDANASLQVIFFLMAGSNRTSGTLATSWAANNNANAAVGQVNNLDSTSNLFHITGIQLQLGNTATAFQNETYAENFIRCARYYEQRVGGTLYSANNAGGSGYYDYSHWEFKVRKRATPTCTGHTGTQQQINEDSAGVYGNGAYAQWSSSATASAEFTL